MKTFMVKLSNGCVLGDHRCRQVVFFMPNENSFADVTKHIRSRWLQAYFIIVVFMASVIYACKILHRFLSVLLCMLQYNTHHTHTHPPGLQFRVRIYFVG